MITGWPCETLGSKSNPPVVFLHGFLGDKRDWEFIEENFAANYYCIFPDLPGHGENRQPLPAEPLSFRWLGMNLKRFLFESGLTTIHLVGYSMGGRAALHFTVHYPKLVKSLTLESASPGLVNRRARRERRLLDEQRAAQILEKGLECFIDDWYQMPLFASLQRNSSLIDNLKKRRNLNDPHAVARVIAELSPGRQPSLWSRLPAIQAPVLLLTGSLDNQYSVIMNKMAPAIPQATLQVAPEAGHNIHLEAPEWYAQCVKVFLQSCDIFA
jgi:2-succinyl-6-hydroxy-2,4-cyclohexadiene-1-carboxylate synthase